MPERDGKGPAGIGPMTGRGKGECIVLLNTAKEEINYLENRRKALEEQLDEINTRLSQLKSLSN